MSSSLPLSFESFLNHGDRISTLFRGQSLDRGVHLWMNCILQDVQFTDKQRFKQFVSQGKARMENRVMASGHRIAAARLDAKLNASGWMSEHMRGISYLEFLQGLEKEVDQNWSKIALSLEEIRRCVISRSGCLVNLTADGKNLSNSHKFVEKFLDSLPSSPQTNLASWNLKLSPVNEAIVIPTKVNYIGKASNIYETGYQLHGSAYVISKYIRDTWLWDRIRVSGGAYGGFCKFDADSGVFFFLSDRDPNLLKTIEPAASFKGNNK